MLTYFYWNTNTQTWMIVHQEKTTPESVALAKQRCASMEGADYFLDFLAW